jgi:hypothetical protein
MVASESFTGMPASSENVEAAGSLCSPGVQQDAVPGQEPAQWLEAAYGCVDWFLYPQPTAGGAS